MRARNAALAALAVVGSVVAGLAYDRVLLRKWVDPRFAHTLKEARDGVYRAQCQVGRAYEEGPLGIGFWGDRASAARWYADAADHGYGPAIFLQAELIRDGDAVERRRLLKLAAYAGVPEAQYNYAAMCSTGEGGPKDEKEGWNAAMWAATNGGDPEAQVVVARTLYENGDHLAAARFFRAAAAPMPPADRAQWAQLEDDPLAEPDAELVVHLRQRRRAPDGQPDAQRHLALQYSRGDGVPADAVRALAWCRMAVRQGDVEAEAMEPTYAAAAGDAGSKKADALVAEWVAGRSPGPDLAPVW